MNGSLNNITAATPVNIERYDPVGKDDVTNSFLKRVISATDNNGNIGIGTLSPQVKLDVNGTIRAKEVKIEMNAGEGADFVFEPSYTLRELSEVDAFIKENKHLPEIPSAKQMQEDGLNVNEMQIKLLQKIEELTLYVIQQQIQLNKVVERNTELEDKLNELLNRKEE